MSWAAIAAKNRPIEKPSVIIPEKKTQSQPLTSPSLEEAFPALGSVPPPLVNVGWARKPKKPLSEEFAAIQLSPVPMSGSNGWSTPIPLVSYPSVGSTSVGPASFDGELATPLPSAFCNFSPPSITRTDSCLTVSSSVLGENQTTYHDFSGEVTVVEASKTCETVLLDDVSKDANQPDHIKKLLAQASVLSKELFSECVVHRSSKRTGWKLALLVSPCQTALFGFVGYRIKASLECLEIGKLATPVNYRNYGFGRKLMRHVIQMAKKSPDVGFVTLSSLPEAIPFYKRLGFEGDENVKYDRVRLNSGEELVEGQVYMELHVGGVRKKATQKKGKR